jgi:signal transduction histidine kinase
MNAQETPPVLIVEDNPLVGEMIKGLLEEAGYTVVGEAADGFEAVEMTQSLRPDVVLMDIKMPGMDGIEATRLIYERCPTPVVMLTAYDTPEMVEEASAAGAGAYLIKPPNAREIEHAITIAMARFDDMMELRRLNAELQAEIAERKRAEEEVTKHRRDLQSLSAQLINAQEAERKRISQELHDEMGQALTAMSINLAAIEKELPSELAPTTRERLAETSVLADQTLEQVRELSLDLRPSMLDDLGLVPTLRWYVNRYAQRLKLEVEFEAVDLEERLTAEMETVLYRVVQEALTNVARHAQANRVHIHLEHKEFKVHAFVEDDGQGFDLQEVAGREALERGAGLLGIRERVASLGGRFSLWSRPGQGTRLTIEIPIAEQSITDCGIKNPKSEMRYSEME